MSTDEERARLLRAIAEGGFNPFEDCDGNTASLLEDWAEELAPMNPPPPRTQSENDRTHVGRTLWRLWLRAKLRFKLRWFGLIPCLAVLWATVEVRTLSAQQGDSLYQLPTVRATLGTWSPTRIWCVTRAADYGTLLVLVSVVPADSTRCTHPDGTHAPLFIDGKECPPDDFDAGPYPFIVFRCGADDYRRFPMRRFTDRRAS